MPAFAPPLDTPHLQQVGGTVPLPIGSKFDNKNPFMVAMSLLGLVFNLLTCHDACAVSHFAVLITAASLTFTAACSFVCPSTGTVGLAVGFFLHMSHSLVFNRLCDCTQLCFTAALQIISAGTSVAFDSAEHSSLGHACGALCTRFG